MGSPAGPGGGERPLSAAPYRFDLLGELPSGVTLLEASAGTGKTFAIAALAARLAAAGVPLSELLLVTFTRMATGELRERVRDRLVDSEQGLSRVLHGAEPVGDEVLKLLCRGSEDELRLRRRHLVEALAGFDAATIATTHGFCQHVLAGLGVAGDVERDVAFVEDVSDLVDETVDDLYVRRFHHETGVPLFDRGEALQIGRAAIDNPHARLEPLDRDELDPHEVWSMRRRLAERVRDELERRKRRLGVMTYDDLLTRLRDTLRRSRARRGRGAQPAGSGTAGCWSTSSRTPTRSSGRSCSGPLAAAARRWC